MLSGHQTKVIALYKDAEVICLDCAAKRPDLGSNRTHRIAMGLSSQSDWDPYFQWEADDAASRSAYECECDRETPRGDYCAACDEMLCDACGKQLHSSEDDR